MNFEKSQKLFEQSKLYIPGGVNSPVRAYKGIGITPPFITKGEGSKIWDEDGNEYIDYVGSWGPLILGHNNKQVQAAICKQLEQGTSFGAPTSLEYDMAKLISDLVPSVEMIRMVNSGTEATMSAIRLARAYTERSKIVKFAGNYHGHGDSLLVKAGSGALTHGIPDSAGITKETVQNTIIADFNDIDGLKKIFHKHNKEIAAVIIEPISGNMGVVPANQLFLDELRAITEDNGTVLIFDEVMTGFRVALGGAQSLYKIKPDLTCFGKIIGGGLPVGAYGGKKEIMSMISPSGPVYQAGTLSGNPLTMAAGYATLKILKDNPKIYVDLENKGQLLEKGLLNLVKTHSIDAKINRIGSMLTLFFCKNEIYDYKSAKKADSTKYNHFFTEMLNAGIYLAPSQFEAMFVSNTHTIEDIQKTLESANTAFCSFDEKTKSVVC
jgi:glutamate-1-semialdehyde 2,1-aminomutase